MKKILLVTDGLFHPPFTARKALRRTLAELDDYEFSHSRSLEKLPDDLESYAAVVLYIHHKDISEAALAKLDAYVSAGGGLLGVHSATACFKQEADYFKIIGGEFAGHGPVESFEVKPVPGSRIFTGIERFTIKDELYQHNLQPGITPHFTSNFEDQEIPAVWTYQYGQGKVCYAMPGHTTATIKNPAVGEILRRGLAWAAGA